MAGHARELAKEAGLRAAQVAAVAACLALMAAGIGMGRSAVLLPVAVPVGLLGLLALVWGLFVRSQAGPQDPGGAGGVLQRFTTWPAAEAGPAGEGPQEGVELPAGLGR
jgi:hypothetical protein